MGIPWVLSPHQSPGGDENPGESHGYNRHMGAKIRENPMGIVPHWDDKNPGFRHPIGVPIHTGFYRVLPPLWATNLRKINPENFSATIQIRKLHAENWKQSNDDGKILNGSIQFPEREQ